MNENNIEQIERLLYSDEDFEKISSYANKEHFNIFRIISKNYDELTFSRTLKYFLDPMEKHNLGDYYLRKFLILIFKKNKKYFNKDNLNIYKIDLLNLKDSKVFREVVLAEKGRIDIYIEIPGKMILLIENKLLSGEGDRQTIRYDEWLDEKILDKDIIKIRVFLTPEGDIPDSKNFLPISFTEIIPIFEPVLGEENKFNNETLFLLENFITWIKEYLPMNEDMKNICRKLYSRYKNELNLIIDNAPTINAFVKDVSLKINTNYSEKVFAHYGSNWLTISPIKWLENEAFQETTKYTLPRLQFEFNEEKRKHLIALKDNSIQSTTADNASITLFGQERDRVESWTYSGDKRYYLIKSDDSFNPENIIDDWNSEIDKFSNEIMAYFDEKFIQTFIEEELLVK